MVNMLVEHCFPRVTWIDKAGAFEVEQAYRGSNSLLQRQQCSTTALVQQSQAATENLQCS